MIVSLTSYEERRGRKVAPFYFHPGHNVPLAVVLADLSFSSFGKQIIHRYFAIDDTPSHAIGYSKGGDKGID